MKNELPIVLVALLLLATATTAVSGPPMPGDSQGTTDDDRSTPPTPEDSTATQENNTPVQQNNTEQQPRNETGTSAQPSTDKPKQSHGVVGGVIQFIQNMLPF